MNLKQQSLISIPSASMKNISLSNSCADLYSFTDPVSNLARVTWRRSPDSSGTDTY
jgi:hypothetical protein